MKLKALFTFTLLALAGTLTLSADTPTLSERAAEISAGRGSITIAEYVASVDDFEAVAQALVSASSERELTAPERTVLTWYASSLPAGSEQEAVYRAADAYHSVSFIRSYITEAEIQSKLIAKGHVSPQRIIQIRQAATRLGKPAIVEAYMEALIGRGFYVPSEGARLQRDTGFYVSWFDERCNKLAAQDTVAALEQVTAEVWSEIVALRDKPETDARNQRIFELRGRLASDTERLKQLKSLQ